MENAFPYLTVLKIQANTLKAGWGFKDEWENEEGGNKFHIRSWMDIVQ